MFGSECGSRERADSWFNGKFNRNAVLGLGVADGVYMWRSRGIDSGVFSRSLMLSAKNAVEYGQVDVLNGESVLPFPPAPVSCTYTHFMRIVLMVNSCPSAQVQQRNLVAVKCRWCFCACTQG